MRWATQPMGKGGSSGGQRVVDNRLISLPQQESIALLDTWRVKGIVGVHGDSCPLSTRLYAQYRACLLRSLTAIICMSKRELILTWSLGRKTVLIDEGREVGRLREVLLVRVQICFHVVQGGPLVTGGGGQLLLVRGMVVLWPQRGSFICGRRILPRREGESYEVTEGEI